MERWRPGLIAERLQSVTSERGFVRLRVFLDHPLVGILCLGGILPPLGEQTEVIQRRRRTNRCRVAVYDLPIIRCRRVGILTRVALADEVQRITRMRARGICLEHLPETDPRRAGAAAAELSKRGLVHLVRRCVDGSLGSRTITRGGGRALDLGAAHLHLVAELAQPLLALTRELLQLNELLLDVVEVGAEIALQLTDRALVGSERVHDALLHPDDLAQLRRLSGVTAGTLSLEGETSPCTICTSPLVAHAVRPARSAAPARSRTGEGGLTAVRRGCRRRP